MKRRMVIVTVAIIALGVYSLGNTARAEAPGCSVETDSVCYQPAAEKLLQPMQNVTEPNIAVPIWLKAS